MKPRLFWERSVDPLMEMAKKAHEEVKTPYEAQEEEDFSPTMPLLSTPMGIIPARAALTSSTQMNLWTGYTNFDLTQRTVERIEAVRGVESLDILTRYRFRVGVAKGFDEALVKRNVREAATASIAWAAGECLRRRGFLNWGVAKTPKKKIVCACGDDRAAVMAKLKGNILVCCSW